MMNVSVIIPQGVKVIDSGTMGFFPSETTVSELSGETLRVSFGEVKNLGAETTVILEVSFSTSLNTSIASYDLTGTQTVGGQAIGSFQFDVLDNVIPRDNQDIESFEFIETLIAE